VRHGNAVRPTFKGEHDETIHIDSGRAVSVQILDRDLGRGHVAPIRLALEGGVVGSKGQVRDPGDEAVAGARSYPCGSNGRNYLPERRVAVTALTAVSSNLRAGVAAVLVLVSLGVAAADADIPGVVVRVQSGDRLVLDTGRERFNITLAGISAPAMDTPLGARSRDALARLCHGEAATLVITGTALDGSRIGQVSCAGRDAAVEQLRRGLAKLNPPFSEIDSILSAAQHEARAEQAGIWAR